MMRWITIFSFLLIVVAVYIFYDITHIYDKDLITDDNMYLSYKSKVLTIKSDIMKQIINNKENKWQLSFATYSYPFDLTDKKDSINLKVGNNFIVINYKSKKYGYIQLISTKPFIGLEKSLKSYFQ